MQHCSDHDRALQLNYFVNNSIRKGLRIPPANVFVWMPSTMKQGIEGEAVKNGQEFFNKPVTKIFAVAVIPRSDL